MSRIRESARTDVSPVGGRAMTVQRSMPAGAVAAGSWLDAPEGRASFDRIAAVAARATGARLAAVALIDGPQQVLVGVSGALEALGSRRAFPVKRSFLEHLMRSGSPIAVRDAREDAAMQDVDTVDLLGVVAYAGAPVIDPEGNVVGAVLALDADPRDWAEEGLETLNDLAGVVAGALARRGGGAASAAEARLAAAHTRVTEAIAFGEPPELALGQIVEALEEYLGDAVEICVADERSGDVELMIGNRGTAERFDVNLVSSAGNRIGRLTVWSGEPSPRLAPPVERAVRAFSGLARIAVEIARERGRLAETARHLTDAQARTRLGTWTWEIEPDRLELSPELLPLLGIHGPPPATCRELASAWIAAADRAAYEEGWREALRTGATEHRAEFAVDSPDGRRRVVTMIAEIRRDALGRAVQAFGIIQDITERRARPDDGRDPEPHRGPAGQPSPVALALITPAGTIARAGSAFCELFDVDEPDVAHRPLRTVVPGLDPGALEATRAGSAADGVVRLERRDRPAIWARASLAELPGGGPDRLLVLQPSELPPSVRDAVAPRPEHTDRLTGLLDRHAFVELLEDRLASAGTPDPRLGVLAIGLDRFNAVNESLGHGAGDEALMAVARRLEEAVRGEDVVARFEGDEFLVLCSDASEESDVHGLARRLQEAIARPIALADRSVRLTASVGIAVDDPAAIGGDLVRDAEIAMHRAKRRAAGAVEVFCPTLRDEAMNRLRIGHDLPGAIERDELQLAFDPVVSLESPRALVGLEAVVRWHHPSRGVLTDADFMPHADELGLSHLVTRFGLRRACELHARWRAQSPGREPPILGVNVSARELTRPGFVEELEAVLDETGMPTGKLGLEITQDQLLPAGGGPTASIESIRALGVLVTLDEFGMGYSSLARLVRYPVDALKLHSSFVAGIVDSEEALAVIEATMDMAAVMELEVVALGVETEAQAQRLDDVGCRFAQGPLFSRTVPEAAVGRSLLRSLPPEGAVPIGVPRRERRAEAHAGPPAPEQGTGRTATGTEPGRRNGTAGAEPVPAGDTAGATPSGSGRLVTINRASAALNVSPSTLRRWADEGRIQTVRTPGGHRRFYAGDIARLQAQRVEAPVVRGIDLPVEPSPEAAAFLEEAGAPLLVRVAGSIYEAEAPGWFASDEAKAAGSTWVRALIEALSTGDYSHAVRASREYLRLAEAGGASLLERFIAIERVSRVLPRVAQRSGRGQAEVVQVRRLLEAIIRMLLEEGATLA